MNPRCENDWFDHNHWLKCYVPFDEYPEEEGIWEDDDEFIENWIRERIDPKRGRTLYIVETRNHPKFTLHRDDWGFYKLHIGWNLVKSLEGSFHIAIDKKNEWYICCDNVYQTWDKIRYIQDKIMAEVLG